MKIQDVKILTDENISPNVIQICDHVFRKDLDVSPGTILVIEETRIRIRNPSYEE